MSKFVLDCDFLMDTASSIKLLGNKMVDSVSTLSSYDVGNDDEFDFAGAIKSIISNMEEAADKMHNTEILISKVVEKHTSLQNNLKFDCTQINDLSNNYTIKKGDTLSEIASKSGVTLDELLKANPNIENPDIIPIGLSIAVPAGSTTVEKNNIKTISNSNSTKVSSNTVASNISNSNMETTSSNGNYNSKGSFQVTTGNGTYQLSEADKELLMAVVASEADTSSLDDCLAVSSVILNRCEASNWKASHGTNPISQIKAPGQFSGYFDGYYKKYMGGNVNNNVKSAVNDALNGTRNCNYLSFRSNGSTSYSSNMVSDSGNRYK